MSLDDATAPACTICRSNLYADELDRYACRPCERRIDRDLLALAGPGGLYARLCLRIHPGKGGGGPAVSGSRGSTMPPNEAVLNLTANGGIVSTLETWVEDWATYGLGRAGDGGRLQHRVDQAIGTLRLNLPRAVDRHPALDEFSREIWKLKRQCEAQISGERAPRRIPVQCPCGGVMRVTLDTEREECPGCGTEYGHTEVLRLTPTTDNRAAA